MKNQTERRASERNYYVDGNTVRRMEAVPDYRKKDGKEKRENGRTAAQKKTPGKKNQERQLRMSKRMWYSLQWQ